jgi:hypothetical protein
VAFQVNVACALSKPSAGGKSTASAVEIHVRVANRINDFVFIITTLASQAASRKKKLGIVDAHRDGKRFIVRADDKLSALLELQSAICASCELS